MAEQGDENLSDQEWLSVQSLGFDRRIRSREDYIREVLQGIVRARGHYLENPVLVPSTATIADIHRRIFEGVHPFAGKFREAGQQVNVGVRRFRAVSSAQISYELNLTKLQAEWLIESGQALLAIAWFHARLERIHPFLDGNGRSGRIVLHSSLAAQYGFTGALDFDGTRYRQALRASAQHLLTPLMQLIGTNIGVSVSPGPHLSPFRIDADMSWGPMKTPEDGLQSSRRKYVDIGSFGAQTGQALEAKARRPRNSRS
jgi:fido (protein-threonine AMPylation protein)